MRKKSKAAVKKKAKAKKKKVTAKKKAVAKKKTKKKAKKKKVVKRIKLEPKLSKDEISTLLDQVQSEERSERAWQEMTSLEPDGSEALQTVEEKLIKQPHESKSKLRTWKYYGK
jgi:hypothetical protein